MPGLSRDPEKRERQVAGLRAGWKAAAAKHAPGAKPPPDAPPESPPEPARAAVTVVPYHEVPDAPSPPQPAAEPAREPKPEPKAEERDGFWAGFLG